MTYHAGVDRGLLDVAGDAGHEGVAILEVGVEVGLWEREDMVYRRHSDI